ncbi:MAG TPA: S8 family peptidase [Microvirga sp.]|jgi:hypothetical protein|nr:S8 family peptidase [Microvirga sp.]
MTQWNGALLAGAIAVALAGCGGGGGGGSGGAGPAPGPGPGATFAGSDALSQFFRTTFDEGAAAQARNDPEFKFQDNTLVYTDGSGSLTLHSFPFASIRAEYAHSAGLDGTGRTIAFVDDGFRLTHRELAGKSITTFGTLTSQDHGTGTAAIAAGVHDGTGLMGVAPGAALHLSSYNAGLAGMAAATRDALAKGAVVQNNSWGYANTNIGQMTGYLASHPGASVEQAFTAAVGGSAVDGKAYLDALRAFTAKGVVVFAASNDKAATKADLLAGLPVVMPELERGWIVAVNAVPQFGSNGRVASAVRMSSGCLEVAATCLTGDGGVRTATAASDTAYGYMTGTSFVAPQIAGGVALLSQAFPNLPAADLRKRLLASADNGFYAHSGSTDFGNGVVHGYNAEFGHGFMDLRAALKPIGTVGLPKTDSAYGPVAALGTSAVVAGSAQGDAVARALSSRSIAVFDALGADFRAPAAVLTGRREEAELGDRLHRFAAKAEGRRQTVSLAFAESGEGAEAGGWRFSGGEAEGVLAGIGLQAGTSDLFAGPGRLASLAPGTHAFGITRDAPEGGALSFYTLSASDEAAGEASAGGGVVRSFRLAGTEVSLGVSALGQDGSVLGLQGTGEMGHLRGAAGAVDFGLSRSFGGLRVFAAAQVGVGSGVGDGLLAGTEGTVFSGFGLGVATAGVLRAGDSLTLSARQPLRIESGTATLSLPVGRHADGAVRWEEQPIDLSPSSRQLDLGVNYGVALDQGTTLRLGLGYSINPGHVAGEGAVSVLGGATRRF